MHSTKTMAGHVWNKGYLWKHFLQTSVNKEQMLQNKKYAPILCLGQKRHYAHYVIKTNQNKHLEQKFTLVQLTAQLSIIRPEGLKSFHALTINETLPISSDVSTYSTGNTNANEKQVKNSGILKTMFNEEHKEPNLPSHQKKEDETNEKKDNQQESAFLRNQRYAKWFLLGSMLIVTPVFVLRNGQPKHNELGQVIEDEFSSLPAVIAYIKRAWSEMKLVKKDIVEPSSKKLLPDPLVEPYYQPPYTLVLELMDVFLRPVYDSVTGWRFKKRPGIDYFLSQVGPPMFEVVIFTRETGMTAYPLIDSMDSKGYIMYRLFRDAARYKSGFSIGNMFQGDVPKLDPYYQKDLRYLNRDLSKVIIVDCDKRAFEKQPENGLCLEKWDGSTNDSTLYDLAAFLKTVATSEVDDVRPVLNHYSTYNHPLEAFKLAQARMQEDILMTHSNQKSQVFAGTGNVISSFFQRK